VEAKDSNRVDETGIGSGIFLIKEGYNGGGVKIKKE
jgi:hypothetical protein